MGALLLLSLLSNWRVSKEINYALSYLQSC